VKEKEKGSKDEGLCLPHICNEQRPTFVNRTTGRVWGTTTYRQALSPTLLPLLILSPILCAMYFYQYRLCLSTLGAICSPRTAQ